MDIKARLRASLDAKVQKVAIYLPDRDNDDNYIENIEQWANRAVRLLTDINGGSTKLPISHGTWRLKAKEEDGEYRGSDKILYEYSIVIYSFIEDEKVFDERFEEITLFLHKFGRETKQNAVMLEFSGGDYDTYFHRSYFIMESDYISESEMTSLSK